MELDRGHLSPSHINGPNRAKMNSTFTLTNTAPQYAKFNKHSWRLYEVFTESFIKKHAPEEYVYIMIGVSGSNLDESVKEIWLYGNSTNKRVKVPKYYWKAVCYPGNKQRSKKPWGFAFEKKNINKKVKPNYQSYVTLKKFAQNNFKDPLFGPECMNTTLNEMKSLFSDWLNSVFSVTETWQQYKDEL